MDSFCGDPFWDAGLTWNTTNPHFTTCFKETVLTYVPCTLLLFGSIIEFFHLKKRSSNPVPWNLLNITKILLSLTLCIISVLESAFSLLDIWYGQEEVYPVQYISPFVRALAFCVATVLLVGYRKKGVHTSALLFLFWTLFSVYALVDYRRAFSKYVLNTSDVDFVLTRSTYVFKTLFFPLVLSEFLLACFADIKPENIFPNVDVKHICPIDYCSFISRISFLWMTPMIMLGYKRPLVQNDMWNLQTHFNTERILDRFDKHWKPAQQKSRTLLKQRANEPVDESTLMLDEESGRKKEQKPTINILFPILRTYWLEMLYLGFLRFINALLMFVGPTVLNYLITFINGHEPMWKGYFYVFVLFFSAFLDSMISNQYEFGINCLGLKVKSSLISTIYKKALRLSLAGRSAYTTGEIVKIMAVDTMYIYSYVNTYNLIWACPLQIAICLKLIWNQLGVASLGGYAVIVLLIPVNSVIMVKIKSLQTKMMQCTADRLKLMNQLLNGIKVLKLYSWEQAFNNQISGIREQEIQNLKKSGYYLAGITFAFTCAPFFIAVASFSMFVLIDPLNVLTPNVAFVSLSLFNLLTVPLALLPMTITMAVMFFVSLKRINHFLDADELEPDQVIQTTDSEYAIEVENGSFAWARNKEATLRNINLKIPRNKLVAIVGEVGAGKSSLFSACLGEMYKVSGQVKIQGKVAYVPQEAWILNATMQNNILFDNPLIHSRYRKVLHVCALEPDLEMLDAGDQTEIGEKGINLSGGQKQRISLARACYNQADCYLFDDPLSAVDTHVGKHLFEKVFGPNGFLKDKSRILITHKVTLLPFVDQIIVVKNCQITEQGTYSELLERKGAFAEILAQFVTEAENEEIVDSDDLDVLNSIKKRIDFASASSEGQNKTLSNGSNRLIKSGSAEKSPLKDEKKALKDGRLTKEEASATGSVKWSVYVQYLRAVGSKMIFGTLIGFAAFSGFNMARSLWLSDWSNDGLDPLKANNTNLRDERLLVYTGFGVFETVITLMTAISVNLAFVKASRHLHISMLKRLICAPLKFFDITPMGRIINRFSEDLTIADLTLRMNFRMFLVLGFRALTSFILMGFSTPLFFVPLAPLLGIYYLIQRLYLASSRQLKRIESSSRSPVFNHFSETVTGVSSIRAYGISDRFLNECHKRIDINNRCCYPGFAASRWMTVIQEFIGYTIVLVATSLTVIYRDSLSPGLAGLSVSYALTVTVALKMMINSFVDVETNIVAVERCIEFTKIEIETDAPDAQDLPKNWPTKGKIEFCNYSARYRKDLNPILIDLNFTIQSGQKCGIVGRTGSGKSSLTLALFRMIERTEGTIKIDDLDIERTRATELRSRLTVIPQDPFVFSGTIRKNVDPLDEYQDEEVWQALEHSHLKAHVDSLPAGLSYQLTEGGDNFSVGQRQLICLARALLRKTSVLVLDEATSAIDYETDELIQQTIRKEFKDCTILTIAHRINTIFDYDRIIVLNEGRLVEFDSPDMLIKDKSSLFYKMAKEAKLVT